MQEANQEKLSEITKILKEDAGFTAEQIAEIEKGAKEKFEYDQKYPHRHRKYNRFENAQSVKCFKCGATHNLILATEPRESSYKKPQYIDSNGNIKGHKKTRHELPVYDNNGNKLYYCLQCVINEAKKLKAKGAA